MKNTSMSGVIASFWNRKVARGDGVPPHMGETKRRRRAAALPMPQTVLAILTAVLSVQVHAWGQTVPSEGQGTFATVESLEGTVRVRANKEGKWEAASVGMKLPEGAEIRTGLKSAVRCRIEPDQTFVLDRLGTVTLSKAAIEGGVVKTDLTLKYGRAQYEIEKAGLEHDARITSPGSTLAVRGTVVELEDSPPFRPRATSYTGRARFTAERKTTPVGAPGGQTASLSAGQQNAAINALEASVIDPQNASSRTRADAKLIAQQTSLGAIAKFDRDANITVVRGGPGPTRAEADLTSGFVGQQGTLAFVARWQGNADINLQVGVSRGDPATTVLATGAFNFSEFIYPGFGLNVSPTGGRTDFDHRGGANGGQEVVYWKSGFPFPATFGVGVINAGGETTDVTVNAFLNGKKLDLYELAPLVPVNPEGRRSTTFTYSLAPDEFATPLVFLPLAEDQPLPSKNPDANNGAPADLPPPPTPPTADGLKSARAERREALATRREERANGRAAEKAAAKEAAKQRRESRQSGESGRSNMTGRGKGG